MDETEQPDEPARRPVLTLEDLQRWEDNGATWRALEVTDSDAVLQLCTCYGEPVDVVRGQGAALIEFIRGRIEAEEPGAPPAG